MNYRFSSTYIRFTFLETLSKLGYYIITCYLCLQSMCSINRIRLYKIKLKKIQRQNRNHDSYVLINDCWCEKYKKQHGDNDSQCAVFLWEQFSVYPHRYYYFACQAFYVKLTLCMLNDLKARKSFITRNYWKKIVCNCRKHVELSRIIWSYWVWLCASMLLIL